ALLEAGAIRRADCCSPVTRRAATVALSLALELKARGLPFALLEAGAIRRADCCSPVTRRAATVALSLALELK
ncbi:hypothetical protein Q2T49_34375, partial [Pseudomonas aeruginosa]|uniref:hypothetical protein n=1 Tax=Pseudomonas aeruginosa TaxID=287 RepID=UPI00265EB55D